jgi:pentapeptide MXKDX repeat protein
MPARHGRRETKKCRPCCNRPLPCGELAGSGASQRRRPPQPREEFAVIRIAATTVSLCLLAAAGNAVAQDAMGKDAMSHDDMSKDAMKKDEMKSDAMAKDAMGKDAMSGDAMNKDSMKKDAMAKDGMGKDAMKKEKDMNGEDK